MDNSYHINLSSYVGEKQDPEKGSYHQQRQ